MFPDTCMCDEFLVNKIDFVKKDMYVHRSYKIPIIERLKRHPGNKYRQVQIGHNILLNE